MADRPDYLHTHSRACAEGIFPVASFVFLESSILRKCLSYVANGPCHDCIPVTKFERPISYSACSSCAGRGTFVPGMQWKIIQIDSF